MAGLCQADRAGQYQRVVSGCLVVWEKLVQHVSPIWKKGTALFACILVGAPDAPPEVFVVVEKGIDVDGYFVPIGMLSVI